METTTTELFGMARIEAQLARAQRIEAALVAIITPLEKGWKVDDMEQRLSEARVALES